MPPGAPPAARRGHRRRSGPRRGASRRSWGCSSGRAPKQPTTGRGRVRHHADRVGRWSRWFHARGHPDHAAIALRSKRCTTSTDRRVRKSATQHTCGTDPSPRRRPTGRASPFRIIGTMVADPTRQDIAHRGGRAVAQVLGRTAFVRVVTLVGTVVLARLLSPAEFGAYAIVGAIVGAVSLVGD